MNRNIIAGIAALGFAVAPLSAQTAARGPFLELRGGAVVPTFDISDVANTGSAFGATLGLQLSPSMVLMAELDIGMHKDEPTGLIDIQTRHYMGKLGFSLTGQKERGWEAMVNLGAGAVTFDVEGLQENTYLAINAGAKFVYGFSPSLALVLSPQGDIAFTEEDDFGSSTAWVWPLTAGLRIRF